MAVTDTESPAGGRRDQLVELYRELQDCRKCPLAEGRNTVVFGTGNADAGLVYRTDAALSRRVRVAFTVTAEQGPRIVYVLAPLADSRKPAALELVRRLAGPEARTIFERYGFQVLAPR